MFPKKSEKKPQNPQQRLKKKKKHNEKKAFLEFSLNVLIGFEGISKTFNEYLNSIIFC
jgi:hypothetical protein